MKMPRANVCATTVAALLSCSLSFSALANDPGVFVALGEQQTGNRLDSVTLALAETTQGDSTTPTIKQRIEIHRNSDASIVIPSPAMGDSTATGLRNVDVIVSNVLSDAFTSANLLQASRSMKNAPYSAEIVTEKNQLLGDGNQISKRTSSFAYRDSAGRTREETHDTSGNVRSVHISDPVESTRYILDPAKKTATKLSLPKNLQNEMATVGEKIKELRSRASLIQRTDRGQARSNTEAPQIKIVEIHRDVNVSASGDISKLEAENMRARIESSLRGAFTTARPA
jgi:hypothetical protein